jgi:hypothetical protein
MKKHTFTPIQVALVPVIYGCKGESAATAALALAPVVVLVGVVVVPEQESLSAGATQARELRKVLRELGRSEQVHSKSHVIVAHKPWADLLDTIRAEQPDLLLLEWAQHLTALSVTLVEVLTRPPCDVALVRRPMSGGPFPPKPSRVLVPIRGGPHAELAARLGLGLRPSQLTALHLMPSASPPSDAPFRGLERVLKRLPEVQFLSASTDDPAQTI